MFAESKFLYVLYVICGLSAVIFIVFAVKQYLEAKKNLSAKALKKVQRNLKIEWANEHLATMYLRLKKIPVIKEYVRQIEQRYLATCPYDTLSIMRLTAKAVGYTILCTIVAIVAIIVLNLLTGVISLYTISCCILVSYICYVEVLNARINAVEDRVSNNFINYIANVKHLFLHYKDVPQAVLEAADGLSIEIRLHAKQLYDILSGANRQVRVKDYALSDNTSWYTKLFLSQAYDASERGETKKADGSSAFTSNLEFLRLEIMKENHSKRLRDYKLQGYTFVVLAPYFAVPFLKQWGSDFFPELVTFYNGAGRFVVGLSFFATLFTYGLITKAKRIHYRQMNKSGEESILEKLLYQGSIKRFVSKIEERLVGKTKLKKMLTEAREETPLSVFILKMLTTGAVMFAVCLIFITIVHTQNKSNLLSTVDNIDTIVVTANERQKKTLAEHILVLSNKYKNVKTPSDTIIRTELLSNVRISNKATITAVVEEIIRRVTQYQAEYMKWYEFLVSIILSVVVAFVPVFDLQYRLSLIKTEKNREIKQFQVLILMEKHFPSVTIVSLLEEMETFALSYQPAIRRCLNNFSAGPREALYALKSEEKENPRFTEIVDGFLSVDTAGIEMAFDEIGSNREMLEKTEELEEEINLSRHIDTADIIAYIPTAILVGVYFIAPICISSLIGTGDIFATMEEFNASGLGWF